MNRLLTLVAVLLALALPHAIADAKAKDDLQVHEETVDAASPGHPQLSEADFGTILSKLSTKCMKEVTENPSDPEKVSVKCRTQLAQKIDRFVKRREEEAANGGKKKEHKEAPKKKKSKKQTRAQREAAEALKKQEAEQQTVKVIAGFVGTLVAVVVGAICIINRKLKAAGMYYPNPDARAAGGCGGGSCCD
ncbi:TPA: hypothetical protein N0F65_007209 [Lagenidium giganteum]|uniref:Uncharacterized protein n=1 Tax=Lagenidium giganteum TaxID=4803 RepID=A0AAV2ZCP8_9STRA|nr:TPA: hypothetical protein N0F65_007209 [Lagenidium giganteum]